MRGYNRNKNDLQPYMPAEPTRDQVQRAIQDKWPSPVEYAVQGGPLPVNLRRSPIDEE